MRKGKLRLTMLSAAGVVLTLCMTACASSSASPAADAASDASVITYVATENPKDVDDEALRKAADLPVGKSIDIDGIKVTKQTVTKNGAGDTDTADKDQKTPDNKYDSSSTENVQQTEENKPAVTDDAGTEDTPTVTGNAGSEDTPSSEGDAGQDEKPSEETGTEEGSPEEAGSDKASAEVTVTVETSKPGDGSGEAKADSPSDTPAENTQTEQAGDAVQVPATDTGAVIDDAAVADFYKNCVFAGDSVLLGFRNYCRSAAKPFSDIQFMAAGSYSLHNALWDVSEKSIHPLYKGEQMQLWRAVDIIKPEKVFLFFGINDMVYGVEDSVDQYVKLIDKIIETAPDTRIYILSATYMLESAEMKKLNNDNLASFNTLMSGKAQENGWGYIDLATPLSDGKGNLNPVYCSDGELHQNKSAYDVWVRVLSEYASGGGQ